MPIFLLSCLSHNSICRKQENILEFNIIPATSILHLCWFCLCFFLFAAPTKFHGHCCVFTTISRHGWVPKCKDTNFTFKFHLKPRATTSAGDVILCSTVWREEKQVILKIIQISHMSQHQKTPATKVVLFPSSAWNGAFICQIFLEKGHPWDWLSWSEPGAKNAKIVGSIPLKTGLSDPCGSFPS